MKTQKELKAIYKADLVKRRSNDEKYINWLLKHAQHIVELEDGSLYIIDKPTLKKDFCFGYRDHVIHEDGRTDYELAGDMATRSKTDSERFMRENLRPLIEKVEVLENENMKLLVGGDYDGDRIDKQIVPAHYPRSNKAGWVELSDTDRKNIADGYKEVVKYMEKRVNAYLKRYGLEHVHSWTYWADA